MPVIEDILAFFNTRKDNRFMGLEFVAIYLGISVSEHILRKLRVVIHSDIVGSDAACRTGTQMSLGHAHFVHAQWLRAAMTGVNMHVIRVPTEYNIADLPSTNVGHI